jgi:hypothetical protein
MGIDTERVQRDLNQQKRKFLAERYGAKFPERQTHIPPEVEGEWLDSITEIESACAMAGEVSVREYLGNPVLKALGEISPGELRAELEQLLDLLMENHIMVTFMGSVSDERAYRFLSMELQEMKIENVRFPSWFAVFMYHPFLGTKRVGMSMNNLGRQV